MVQCGKTSSSSFELVLYEKQKQYYTLTRKGMSFMGTVNHTQYLTPLQGTNAYELMGHVRI